MSSTSTLKVTEKDHVDIPLNILKDRSLSVLEVIVEYLLKQQYTYHDIAILLNRDDRTIWTIASRIRKKRT